MGTANLYSSRLVKMSLFPWSLQNNKRNKKRRRRLLLQLNKETVIESIVENLAFCWMLWPGHFVYHYWDKSTFASSRGHMFFSIYLMFRARARISCIYHP